MSGRRRDGETLMAALQLAIESPTSVPHVARVVGVSEETARATLRRAVADGFLESSPNEGTRLKSYTVTDAGREKAAQLVSVLAVTRQRQKRDMSDIGKAALALIDDCPAGIDLHTLSDELLETREDIDIALAPYLAGGRVFSRLRTTLVEGENVLRTFFIPADNGLDIDRVHHRHDDVIENGDAGTALQFDRSLAAAAPAAQPVREVSGDEYARAPAETTFHCALFSDGRFLLHLDGKDHMLPVEQTRELVHYLDHLAAEKMLFGLTGSAA